jgi:hypothetical protein
MYAGEISIVAHVEREGANYRGAWSRAIALVTKYAVFKQTALASN